jgi:hypothetical protein
MNVWGRPLLLIRRLGYCYLFLILFLPDISQSQQQSELHGSVVSGQRSDPRESAEKKRDLCFTNLSAEKKRHVEDAYNKLMDLQVETNQTGPVSLNSGTARQINADLTAQEQIALQALVASKLLPIPGCQNILKDSNKNGHPDILEGKDRNGVSYIKAFYSLQLQAHKAFRSINPNRKPEEVPNDFLGIHGNWARFQNWMSDLDTARKFLWAKDKMATPEMAGLVDAYQTYEQQTLKRINQADAKQIQCLQREILRRNSAMKEILNRESNLAQGNFSGSKALKVGEEASITAAFGGAAIALSAFAIPAGAAMTQAGLIGGGISAASGTANAAYKGWAEAKESGEEYVCSMVRSIQGKSGEIVLGAIVGGSLAMLPGASKIALDKMPPQWRTLAEDAIQAGADKGGALLDKGKKIVGIAPKTTEEVVQAPSALAKIGSKATAGVKKNADKIPTAYNVTSKEAQSKEAYRQAKQLDKQADASTDPNQRRLLRGLAVAKKSEALALHLEAFGDAGAGLKGTKKIPSKDLISKSGEVTEELANDFASMAPKGKVTASPPPVKVDAGVGEPLKKMAGEVVTEANPVVSQSKLKAPSQLHLKEGSSYGYDTTEKFMQVDPKQVGTHTKKVVTHEYFHSLFHENIEGDIYKKAGDPIKKLAQAKDTLEDEVDALGMKMMRAAPDQKEILRAQLTTKKEQLANLNNQKIAAQMKYDTIHAMDELFADTGGVLLTGDARYNARQGVAAAATLADKKKFLGERNFRMPQSKVGQVSNEYSMLNTVRKHLWDQYLSQPMTNTQKAQVLDAVHSAFAGIAKDMLNPSNARKYEKILADPTLINKLIQVNVDKQMRISH